MCDAHHRGQGVDDSVKQLYEVMARKDTHWRHCMVVIKERPQSWIAVVYDSSTSDPSFKASIHADSSQLMQQRLPALKRKRHDPRLGLLVVDANSRPRRLSETQQKLHPYKQEGFTHAMDA